MHRLALTGLLPVLFAAMSGAQNPSVLTEAEFLSVLDESHPAVVESAEALAHAETRILESRTLENPILGGVREDPRGPVRQTDIVVSWQLPHAARGTVIRARERQAEAARARLAQQLLNYRLAMRQAYADWAVAEARERRLSDQAERLELLAERELARSEKGEASGLEAHRLRLAASALRSRVALAAAESDRARAEIAGWYPDLDASAHPALPDLSGAPSFDGPDARILAAEAELRAATLEREAASRFVAFPEVSVGWQRQELGPEAIGGPIVGLAWSVPLFDRKKAARQSAEASLTAAGARLELVQREVRASRAAAQTSSARLSAALARAREQLASVERMLDGAETAFRHGEVSLTDLLETHRSVTEAELAALELHESALAADRELERLAGTTKSALLDEPSESTPQESAP